MERRRFVLISWERLCIGILLIGAVNSCPDTDNATMSCDINPVAGLSCTYIKGTPQDLPIEDFSVPGPVAELNVATGSVSIGGTCLSRLNVTWTVQYDGSISFLRGFFLSMSFLYKNQLIFLNRTFAVSATNWTTAHPTLFRHECVVPALATLYHVELYSLPMNSKRHNKTAEYRTASNSTSNTQWCDRKGGDLNNSGNWVATMWASENPANASVEACFYTAPPSFNFSQYFICLLPNNADQNNMCTDYETRTVDVVKDVIVCKKFLNICSGTYKINVRPMGNCLTGGQNWGSCVSTVVESINMTSSVCASTTSTTTSTSTSTTTSATTSPTTSETTVTTSPQPQAAVGGVGDTSKIAGIVVGVVLAVILVTGLAVGLCFIRHRSNLAKGLASYHREGGKGFPPPRRASLPSVAIDRQQTVLLVYSCDNEHHRKVVRNFAAFLHACCKCDVRFDDWSQVDISQTNALDWLTKQLHQVRHIIFINSLGASMQHRAWIEGATCIPVKELLLPDMFIPALRQIQARVYEKPATKLMQYYHVYFPYTDAKHLLDVSFGQRYKLMKHVEDLFLNIHGMTKYSQTGLTSACQINAKGYTGYAEGKALHSAIEEASEYYRMNPNWFLGCYTCLPGVSSEKPVALVNYRQVNGDVHRNSDCQPLTVQTSIEGESPRPASLDSADSNASALRSSDEGVYSDPDIVPPWGSVSTSSDADQRSISGDVGFGDTLDDSSIFDPNSPSVQLGFCPPIPDDDDNEETTSMGSHAFFDKLNELNEQYDSGIPFSSFELKPPNRSSC